MADSPEIGLSELIGALSSALDEGEPPGHAVRSCLIGVRLADRIGFDAEARSDLFYALLLKDAGCSANAEVPVPPPRGLRRAQVDGLRGAARF
jgi:hypothetical protein